MTNQEKYERAIGHPKYKYETINFWQDTLAVCVILFCTGCAIAQIIRWAN